MGRNQSVHWIQNQRFHLELDMTVGIFCLTSDSTHRPAIHMGKAVIPALMIQVQPHTGKKNTPLLLKSWKKTNFLHAIRVLHGSLELFAARVTRT
eukprot:7619733-Ditylum_brightwellii.AAC.1